MIGGYQFVNINQHHFRTNDIMRQIVNIVNYYIISKIATDDGRVVEAHRHFQIAESQTNGL